MTSPTRYLYSLVRCVPDPRTGEFVNIAAIAGDPESDDWAVRQVSSEVRVRKLANAASLTAVHGFLAKVGDAIESLQTLPFEETLDVPSEEWLQRLFTDYRNVVQLSPPTPVLAPTAEDALDLVFAGQIIDPVAEPRQRLITKHRVLQAVRRSYESAHLRREQLRRRVDLHVGDLVHTVMDYAVANEGAAVQLSQCWSFQGQLADSVAEQVKAWGYAVARLRDGDKALVLDMDDWRRGVTREVDLQVVITPAITSEQQAVFSEAQQVFDQIGAHVHYLEQAAEVGVRAAELLGIN